MHSNCDNEAVVSVINSGRCEHELMMHLMRWLFFFAAKYNFVLVAKQIPIISNTLADALSHNKLELFFFLAHFATPIPPSLLVGLVLKRPDWTSLDWTGLDSLVHHYFQCSLAPLTRRAYVYVWKEAISNVLSTQQQLSTPCG